MPAPLLKCLVAEAVGVFALCFVAILAANGGGGLVAEALASGLIIAALIAALGGISGAHFNPAVTLAFFITGRIAWSEALAYVVAQLSGGVVAAVLLALALGAEAVVVGTPRVGEALGTAPGVAALLEACGAFLLVLVIFGAAVDQRAPRYVFPLAIGLTITAVLLGLAPLSGAALNPARVFGPALVSGTWDVHWIYWAGPLTGGVLAAALQHWFLLPGGLPAPQPESA